MTGAENDPTRGEAPRSKPPADRSGAQDDTRLREAAHRLVETLQPYRVLTRANLDELSGASGWEAIDFELALRWSVDHNYLRSLGGDLYELGPEAHRDEGTGLELEGGW